MTKTEALNNSTDQNIRRNEQAMLDDEFGFNLADYFYLGASTDGLHEILK